MVNDVCMIKTDVFILSVQTCSLQLILCVWFVQVW